MADWDVVKENYQPVRQGREMEVGFFLAGRWSRG